MTDAEAAVRRLIDDVLDLSESAAARNRLAQWVQRTGEALAAGDPSAAGPALAYLEADPYYFRSGYARTWLAGRLSRADLGSTEVSRARDLVVDVADGRLNSGMRGVARLARSVADNQLRRDLRARLHSDDQVIARRALHILSKVRRPGITAEEIRTARQLVLDDASKWPYLLPSVDRLARWLWNPEWQAELRDTTLHHGPHRAGAKRLIERAEQRKKRRPGP
jgi:hypothetical protein